MLIEWWKSTIVQSCTTRKESANFPLTWFPFSKNKKWDELMSYYGIVVDDSKCKLPACPWQLNPYFMNSPCRHTWPPWRLDRRSGGGGYAWRSCPPAWGCPPRCTPGLPRCTEWPSTTKLKPKTVSQRFYLVIDPVLENLFRQHWVNFFNRENQTGFLSSLFHRRLGFR